MKCSKFYKTISVLILGLVLSIFLYLIFSGKYGDTPTPPIAVNNYIRGTSDIAGGGTSGGGGGTTGGGGGTSGGINVITLPAFNVTNEMDGSGNVRLSSFTTVDGDEVYNQTDSGSLILQTGDIIWYASVGFIVTELANGNLSIMHKSSTFLEAVGESGIENAILRIYRNVINIQNDISNKIQLDPEAGTTLVGMPVVLIPDLATAESELQLHNNCQTTLTLQLPYNYHATLINENGESLPNVTESTEVYLDHTQKVVIKPTVVYGANQLEFTFVV